MLQHDRFALLPVMQAVPNVDPVPHPHSLPLRRLDIVASKGRIQCLLAGRNPLVVHPPRLLEVLLGLGLLNLLPGLEDQHEQVGLLDFQGLVVGDVDPAEGQDVLGAQERVRQRAVGVVDERGRGLGARLVGGAVVPVRVVARLQTEELAAQGPRVDGEVALRRRAVREGFWEEIVVGFGR